MKKTTQLKSLVRSPQLEFLVGAHNGISAKIVEEAGFKGIWASGLAISASLGVRDNNELSWTQVLEMVEFMSDATTIPILLDGDNGYGDFNSVRRLVKKLEQRGVAGVCLEDKLFPKTNSFIEEKKQMLVSQEEFSGKIKAAKDTQTDNDFIVVARTESLIVGADMEEALKRADAYMQAGADAILIHSKKSSADEILEFKKHWGSKLPIIIVPTKYYNTPAEVFRTAEFSIVIWANHLIRAEVHVMQDIAKRIFESQSIAGLEQNIVSVDEIFRLQNAEELLNAEKRYAQY